MPTDAFYKLDQTKKEQLIESAIHEFSELPYEKVSIFKIAQNSGISRSGFYYYFKDKRDIYNYLIFQIKDEFIEKYDLQNKTYDLFGLCEKIFEFITDIKGNKREPLFRRIVTNINSEDLKTIFEFIEEDRQCEVSFDMQGVDLKSVDQLKGLIMMISTAIMFSASGYMENEYDLEHAKQRLEDMFSVLKHGIAKGV